MHHSKHSSLLSNIIDPRLIPKGPFRLFNKSIDDERLALVERFRREGLDIRKLSDQQRLPIVWRWLVDAEINCQSLRHQIEKMRIQQEQELQEVEHYVGQVWKLSTERLIVLEEENRVLRQNQANSVLDVLRPNKQDQFDDGEVDDDDEDDDDDDDSDIELQKCLYGKQINLVPKQQLSKHSGSGTIRLHNSCSTSSLSTVNSANNVDSLQRNRYSKSSWNLNVNTAADSGNGSSVDGSDNNSIEASKVKNDCDKCQTLEQQINTVVKSSAKLSQQLTDANERNFVLEKLNRCIEIENENFAYKLAEAENRSNQLERRILLLEKECNRSTDAKLVNEQQRRVVDELNQKVKKLEEELDFRLQLLEELELKYNKQKEKHQETFWKLRKFAETNDEYDDKRNRNIKHDSKSNETQMKSLDRSIDEATVMQQSFFEIPLN